MKRIFLFILIFILITLSAIPVSANKLSSAKRQKDYIDNKINSISKQKQKEKKKLKSAVEEKKDIESTQKEEKAEYKRLKEENDGLTADIDEIKEGIDQTMDQYNQQQEMFKTRIRAMYEKSDEGYLTTLVQSDSISDFLAKLKYVSIISKRDKQLIEEIDMVKTDTEYKKRMKENMLLEKQQQLDDQEGTLNSLKASRADVEDQIREINSKLDKLNDQEDELLKKSDELTGEIRSLQKKAKYAGGSMMWPSPSSHGISSYYGMRMHPILKKYKMHTGIDINASYGTSIIAANNGTVIVAGWQSGYGYTVIIDHGGGISTLYAHCSKLYVGVGDNVNEGAVIAKVGSTGLSTGPHLHFEVRRNGATTDPLNYVSP